MAEGRLQDGVSGRGTKMQKRRTYSFPNALIHVLADLTCREQPKWCMNIMVPRSRAYVAEALRELRIFRREVGKGQGRG